MIGLEDRRILARDIEAAHQAGARLRLACEVAGIDVLPCSAGGLAKASHRAMAGPARRGRHQYTR
jgi:hypothetical protein